MTQAVAAGTKAVPDSRRAATSPGQEGDLVVRGLVRQYPGGAGVAGIDLTVAKGEMISLLGASGCGKTTTLRCLAGIDTPTGGEIWIGGQAVWSATAGINLPPERRNIGMVFQSYALWPHMTALENVMFPLRARKITGKEARERARKMLELVGLGAMADRSPDRLSGGQQQRVALARAMVYHPKLLLFDEPLSNLDAELRETVRQDIRRTQRELGITALYVTHDRTEAMALSDRLIVMAEGRFVQAGTPAELLARPASPFVASLLGSANLVRGEVADAADGLVTVVAAGARFTGRAAGTLPTGAAAVVSIRPTALRLGVPGEGAPVEANRGRIRDWYPTGPEFEYVIEAGDPGGPVLKALSHADFGLTKGDEVMFWYDPQTATCFGQAS
ncbi:ABC transporter ATP-binding protein [Phytohabitans sp. ZYX-F-186]|uniref:ABC transporter ATP-binding protein n=1 Tax=Phytohabitans maris TaxID=3071409 RepID=A0ABU0ZDV4_9ACTN|nr:ABC transporter ATP-binding protein [Phytohabitans sp. ZYX-F-186]MDQ7904614.1 ABC transporter ATP-binding protein [Phytohabitans sp. ZYX-F-186]